MNVVTNRKDTVSTFLSFYFLWIISASFTDKLVFTPNNGEIIYSGCKAVKCIQLCFLHHLVNHQLGLNLMCYCWGGRGRIYKSGVPSCLCCQRQSWARSPRAQTGQLLGTGNGAILGTVTYKWEVWLQRPWTAFSHKIFRFIINWSSFHVFPLHSTDHFSHLLKNRSETSHNILV